MRPHVNSRRGRIERALLSTPLPTSPLLVACLLGLAAANAMPARASDYNTKGRWDWVHTSNWDSLDTDGKLFRGGGTHMALLRGSGDASYVLHWHLNDQARLWRANPLDNFGEMVEVPCDSSKIFCSGHATLANGKLLVVGGALVSETGEKRCVTFDATNFTGPGKGWRVVDTTAAGHWYPTATTRGDGTVLATAGWEWKNMVMFGGAAGTSETATDSMRVLYLREHERWNQQDPITTSRPTARHGHSAVYWNGFTVVMGGVDQSGNAPSDTVRILWGNDYEAGRFWGWPAIAIERDVSGNLPPARSRHTAVILGDSMYICGGMATNGTPLDDVWRLTLIRPTATTPLTGRWTRMADSLGSPIALPSARYGHAAVLVKGDRARPEMLVLGGFDGSNFEAENVHSLVIPRAGGTGGGGVANFQWATLSPSGSAPGPRDGHSAVTPLLNRNDARTHQMVVFGGRTSTSTVVNELWVLEQPESAPSPTTTYGSWAWRQVSRDTLPSARWRHAAAWDHEWQRVVVFGGDSTPATSGGGLADLWELNEITIDTDQYGPGWVAVEADTMPIPRWGHTLTFDIRGYDVRFAELYHPTTGNIGDWEQHDVQPKWLPPYPFMFNLTDGKVFFAGNGPEHAPLKDSWIYSVGQESWNSKTYSQILGGSAVYWPDLEKVMKSGGDDDVTFQATHDSVSIATFTGGSASWSVSANKLPQSRTYHNLTQLPDGRVLLSGGKTHRFGTFTPIAHMGDGVGGSWGSELAADLGNRGYHSTALLLPDARVLCAGGPGVNSGDWRASIFSPPYLYKDGTTLADRPTITTHPSVIHYGEPFYLVVDNASNKKIVSLIRPGAPTHGFDQNQRYVKQDFTKYISDQWLRSVLTTNPNHVPPGDYLLFVVDSAATGNHPSVGKWVRIESQDDVTAPAAPAIGASSIQCPPALIGVTLSWTAPGDDGTAGTATEYDLRRSTSPITDDASFANADECGTDVPRRSGSTEHVMVTDLTSTRWYFGLKTRDERSGGWSALSTYDVTLCGGGGGGGLPEAARPAVEGSTVVAQEQWVWLGSLTRGTAGLTVSHAGSRVQVDSAMIFRVPRVGNTMTLAAGGRLGKVERRPPRQVTTEGTDITGSLAGHRVSASDRLVAYFAPGEGQVQGLRLEVRSAAQDNTAERSGIRILTPDDQGGWLVVDNASPRPNGGEFVTTGATADSVCLEFVGGYELGAIERLVALADVPELEELPLEDLRHSRLGRVLNSAEPLELNTGEALDLRASLPESGVQADVFLHLKTSTATGQGLRSEMASGSRVPAEFALSQNEPNPFGAGTVIRFALPTKSQVALEVFDVHGRRVRTLTKAEWSAGEHSIEWNGRDAQGRRLGPGVYLYRMQAGSFRATRKLVVSL